MSASVHEIMQELQATDGLEFASLFARDGATLVSAALPAQSRARQRAMAIGIGAIQTIGQSAREEGLVQRAIIEMDGARVLFSYLADKAVLCVMTDDTYNTGLLVSTTHKWEQALLAALSSPEPASELQEAP